MIQCELEQAIMEAWNTKNDLDTLMEYVDKVDMTGQDVHNTLLGISQLHQMRMNKVMYLFEALLQEQRNKAAGVE